MKDLINDISFDIEPKDEENKQSANETTVKVKISGLAVTSLILSAFLLMFLSPLFFPLDEELFFCNFLIGPFLTLGAAVFGIAALIQRAVVARRCWWLAIAGITIIVTWVVILCKWAEGIVCGWS